MRQWIEYAALKSELTQDVDVVGRDAQRYYSFGIGELGSVIAIGCESKAAISDTW